MSDANEPKLKKLGVRDSKLLSPTRRVHLAKELEKIALDYVVLKISPQEIDEHRTVSNLNKLEIEKMAHLVNVLRPDVAYIDAIEANTSAFKRKILTHLEHAPEIVAENYADRRYPVVSAASIVAKVTRDAEISALHERYGNFGSGYPSDPDTVKFLKEWMESNSELPDCVRKSWATAIVLHKQRQQKSLQQFGSDDE